MKLALAIFCVAMLALDAQASGGRVARAAPARVGGPHPVHAYPGHVHPSHVHGTVVVGATFVGLGYWPGYYPGYYYAPPPVYVAPPPPPVSYWYYCAPLAAYYPYVPSCPAPWQPVPATPPNY